MRSIRNVIPPSLTNPSMFISSSSCTQCFQPFENGIYFEVSWRENNDFHTQINLFFL